MSLSFPDEKQLTYLEPTVEPEPSNPYQLWLKGLYMKYRVGLTSEVRTSEEMVRDQRDEQKKLQKNFKNTINVRNNIIDNQENDFKHTS